MFCFHRHSRERMLIAVLPHLHSFPFFLSPFFLLFLPRALQPIFKIPPKGTNAKELTAMLEYTRDAGDPEKRRKSGKVRSSSKEEMIIWGGAGLRCACPASLRPNHRHPLHPPPQADKL